MLLLYEVGTQVASKRKELRMTQSDLAKQARISRATVDALENGRSGELGFQKITRLLTVLGLELKIQPARSRRPTLDELMEENRNNESWRRRD